MSDATEEIHVELPTGIAAIAKHLTGQNGEYCIQHEKGMTSDEP